MMVEWGRVGSLFDWLLAGRLAELNHESVYIASFCVLCNYYNLTVLRDDVYDEGCLFVLLLS